MHLIRSSAIGTEVIDNVDHHVQGKVTDLLVDPDRGKIVAIFIASPTTSNMLALQVQDVASWGNRVHINEPESIGELKDFIRLESFLDDNRTVIGQKIRTENGVSLGKCVDVQFRTDTFDVEWIFPKKFFRKGPALPVNEILEITPDAIIIKDQGPREEKIVDGEEVIEEKLEKVASPAAGRRAE